jgi:hypothetical protein
LTDSVLTQFIAPVAGDDVGRDPVKPGSCVAMGNVVAKSTGEGGYERVPNQVVYGISADSACYVAVDEGGVSVEQNLESRRLGPRPLDLCGVVPRRNAVVTWDVHPPSRLTP